MTKLGPSDRVTRVSIPVIDCHSDVMIDVYRRRRNGERAVLSRIHLPAYAEGGVVAAICTVGGDAASLLPLGVDEPYRSTLAMLDALHAEVAESDGRFEIVSSVAEVRACLERGTFAIIPSVEGASPFQGDLDLVRDLFDRGLRVVGLACNGRNELAVGMEAGDGGLSEIGAEAVRLMNELGLLVDLAHASPTTFWDVVAITSAPVFVSHANAKALCDHPRNLDDDQLRAIASSGGAVGVVFCPNFIGPRPVTVDHLVDHLEYLHAAVGDDSLVIGADFIDYAAEEMIEEARRNPGLYDEDTWRYPEGIETVSAMQNVIRGMEVRGVDAVVVDKVARANFLRIFEQTQALAGVSAAAGRPA